jgi:hypothetical protein
VEVEDEEVDDLDPLLGSRTRHFASAAAKAGEFRSMLGGGLETPVCVVGTGTPLSRRQLR